MPENQQIIEPLAKFHAQVYRNGRIAIPKNERDYFGIDQHDIVELIIRKIENGQIKGRGWFIAQLTVRGVLTIPLGLRKELDISDGDFVEVLLIGFIRIEDVVGERGLKIMRALRANDYRIISDEDEKRLLAMVAKGAYNMLFIAG
ncbi:AbrB/MazE/SpoVT family DNA-binding domain-containing protein [Pyrococcus yayanosii]|uniref:SpoVT/AbrB family transcriptional regulator n=1 Tax=Pyrococcus yayanosii (strain CH1 / JCM 16557) TaxID=529709 RepID=F8AG44_PYRYC|nr:AbrB/MazE/SpoVT family DNA-binding domain-containing protein [Pyrococcus yayanosii]AEH25100.1 SpoVT/AbrB family transcriptional regulator [Pyrococcus yayanosii CH1]